MPSAVIMAGGTGGHIFPALAVASALRDLGWTILWLGTADRLEAEIVPKHGYPIHFLPVKGIRGKGIFAKLQSVWGVIKSILSAIKPIKSINPDVVLGFGGYPSFPGGIAARFLGKPLVIHEQNASAGLTNKLLGKVAKEVFLGFPSAASAFTLPAQSIHVVGNPVRADIAALGLRSNAEINTEGSRPFHLLILGGSLGARPLNSQVPEIVGPLAAKYPLSVRHQCGKGNQQAVNERYANAGVNAKVSDFIDDMASAYAWADAVICRAGALTVAEIAAAGVAACFVPLPHAVDDHQTKNARYLADNNAAILMSQTALEEELATVLTHWITHPDACQQMGELAAKQFPQNATQSIVNACMQYGKE